MLEALVALVVPAAIAIPHVLPLHCARPLTAVCVWLPVLALRALVSIGGALFVFVYLPQTDVFRAMAEWCWHEVVPLVALHLGLSGHPLAHAAVVLPALALAVSVLWMAFGLTRAWLALRRYLAGSRAEGPLGATLVSDGDIVVAATRVGRARIIVSDGALRALDRAELRAGLAHEHGHLRRRHRPVLLAASVLSALGRPLPGTKAAKAELLFNLERDADAFAVRETRDPLALASAICKAATAKASPVVVSLSGGGRVVHRVNSLMGPESDAADRVADRAGRVVAVVLAGLVLGLAGTLPAWGSVAPPVAKASSGDQSCPH